MVWPIAPDRLSPSGPILPFLQGSIIQIGSDTLREPQVIGDGAPFFVLRAASQPTPQPIQVTLQGYTVGNPVLVAWTLGGAFDPDTSTFAKGVGLFGPALQIGAQGYVVTNALEGESYGPDPNGEVIIDTATHVALFVPDPTLVTADPVVGILGQVLGLGDPAFFTIGGGFNMADGEPLTPFSSWLTVAEIDARAVPAIGPSALVPF